MKKLRKHEREARLFLKEAGILKSLRHKNIVLFRFHFVRFRFENYTKPSVSDCFSSQKKNLFSPTISQ